MAASISAPTELDREAPNPECRPGEGHGEAVGALNARSMTPVGDPRN